MSSVVIEGVEIPEQLIADEVQHHPGSSAEEARLSAARALAIKALLLGRAEVLALTAEPELDDDGREETPEEALIRALLDREIAVQAPTEAECRRVYRSHLASRVDAPPFAAIRDQIAEGLERRAWTRAAARYVAGLAAAARAKGVAIRLSAAGAAECSSVSLGELIGEAGAAHRLPAWLAVADPGLHQRLITLAESEGSTPGEVVRREAADFIANADDAAWTSLVGAIRDAPDPALAALARLLRDRIAPSPRRFTVIRRRA